MHLLPHELDKLLLTQCGLLAQRRMYRGLRLNRTEAIALISTVLLELIRDGSHTVPQLMDVGRRVLGRQQVLDGVPDMIDDVQVEGCFADGVKLVTVHEPISADRGDDGLALYGSGLEAADDETTLGKDRQWREPTAGAAQQQKQKRQKIAHAAASSSSASSSSSSSSTPSSQSPDPFPIPHAPGHLSPSVSSASHALNAGRSLLVLSVMNHSDRPIQVGSHYHFSEVNAALSFDRQAAYGRRLSIAAGTAVRFEPGERKRVPLVLIAGNAVISGGNRLSTGQRSAANQQLFMAEIARRGFRHQPASDSSDAASASSPLLSAPSISRLKYMRMYGPTTGDRIHLADTGLIAEVEYDFITDNSRYGDECVFGGGKTLREGMGQRTLVSGGGQRPLDLLVCNAVVIDWRGVYKADIGVRDGLIVGIGKAGNSDVMDGVDDGMQFGVNTEVINAAGLIVTAGAVDSHVHFICPQLCDTALAAGVTTVIGGGTGPTSGTSATTCTPNAHDVEMMLKATDSLPLNIGLTGKGNCSDPAGLEAQLQAGCLGLKLHEDWGTTPSAIDCCLSVAERYDVQVTIHTDTLNESCNVEQTVAAIAGRAIHAYHSEGAGGGHAPDIITVCGVPNIIPSSTNPTRPFSVNTVEEHVDMLMVCHHLSRDLQEDVAFAESRIRGETIAAEDVLHDTGAISIMSSDSQAMGRVGETVMRTWQTAAKMKQQRGHLQPEQPAPYPSPYPASAVLPNSSSLPPHDNHRLRRYISKYTINPALAHGVGHCVGSVEVGKLADLVLYQPALFGSRPDLVLKGGSVALAVMGDSNASIPTPQPRCLRPMWASMGAAASGCSLAFVSQAGIDSGRVAAYGLRKRAEAVRGCRSVGKADMRWNAACPSMQVDPETFIVKADGQVVSCEPAAVLPLAQRYCLY